MAQKIADPTGEKEPLRRNIFLHLRDSESALTPLFPYLGPGDIVPCGAVHISNGMNHGSFHHQNDVDEVLIVWGSSNPRVRAGQVFVTAREHNVSGPSPENPDDFFASCITQRMKETGEQNESMTLHCDKCHGELYRLTFSVEDMDKKAPLLQMLSSIAGSQAWYENINSNPALRTCKQCGHENPEFPVKAWGWDGYVRRTEIMEGAKRVLLQTMSAER